MMRVTLTTDASFCDLTRAAGWAAWAQSERGRFFGGNAVQCGAANSAEMQAAARGLRIALERGIFLAGDHVVLQTDSLHVATRLGNTYLSRRQRARRRRGLPEPSADAISFDGPRGVFLGLAREHRITLEIVCSRDGDHMREVDRFSRHCMTVERAVRQGLSIEAAHLAAFEKAMIDSRVAWLRDKMRTQEPPVLNKKTAEGSIA
jgi:hypothetical protein